MLEIPVGIVILFDVNCVNLYSQIHSSEYLFNLEMYLFPLLTVNLMSHHMMRQKICKTERSLT